MHQAIRLSIAALVLVLAKAPLHAQELQATVTVSAPQLTIIDPSVMDEFERVVTEFLNNTSFTGEVYEEHERINCSFNFNVQQELDDVTFISDVLVQSSRPVFKSDYSTTLFNYLDSRARVRYEQYQPMDYNPNTFINDLTALLSFYAHIIIGVDKDSFSPLGGENSFRLADQLVSQLPPNLVDADKGWSLQGNQNSRFRLLQEFLNPRARPFRQMMYDYHINGLDQMAEDPIAGRTIMASSMTDLPKVRQDIPNSLLLGSFSIAKAQELVSVFAPATPKEKENVYTVMTSIDPTNANKYRALR